MGNYVKKFHARFLQHYNCLRDKNSLHCEDFDSNHFTDFMAQKMDNSVWYTLLEDLDTLEQGSFHIFHRSKAWLKRAEFLNENLCKLFYLVKIILQITNNIWEIRKANLENKERALGPELVSQDENPKYWITWYI